MTKRIIINGRFLTGPLTGVQRTAYEMVRTLDNIISKGEIDLSRYDFTIIYSGQITNPIILKNIRLAKKGWLKGNLWEQLELPFYAKGHLLINMCSMAPLCKRYQVLFVHDVSFLVNKHFFGKLFRLWYSIAIPHLGRFCRHIVTVSNFSKNELIKHASVAEDKITVIYNAADHVLKFGVPSIDFISRINSLKPFCLAVSSLGANKNFKGLSEAIGKITFGDHNMLIAGGGIGILKSQIPDSSSVYLGYVSDAELKYLYQNASLFIFPSFYEGFGIPPLEAMTFGCAVIASHTSAIPEVLQDACAYFNPSDIDDMGEKIQNLIQDKTRLDELKSKGYIQATNYNWEKSALQLVNLIDNL